MSGSGRVATQAQTIVKQHPHPNIHHVFARKLNAIWRQSGRPPRLGLSISGGVDSMALASLCHDVVSPKHSSKTKPLAAGGDFPRIEASFTAFIVDHKLRRGSDIEARRVAAELEKLDIATEILDMDWGPHYGGNASALSNMESLARKLRYRTLGKACADKDINSLLVAHHTDDQAETVMLRILTEYLGWGLSGIKSRAAIPECSGIYGVDQSGLGDISTSKNARRRAAMPIERGGVSIARPLLDFRKEQLVEICETSGVQWFEDLTNADPTLTLRNTVRSLQDKNVFPVALQKEGLLQLAEHMTRKRATIETAVDKHFSNMTIILDVRSGTAVVELPQTLPHLSQTPRELQTSLLRRLVELVGTKEIIHLHRLAPTAIKAFAEYDHSIPIEHQDSKHLQVAGAHIERDQSGLKLHRAVPTSIEKRDAAQTFSFPPQRSGKERWSEWHLWDGRYWIRVLPPHAIEPEESNVSIRFFRKEDIEVLRKSMEKPQVHRLNYALNLAKGSVRFTLPAIVFQDGADERVVALPSLNWSVPGWTRATSSDSHTTSWRWDIRYKHVERREKGTHWKTLNQYPKGLL